MTLITTVEGKTVKRIRKRTLKIIFSIISPSLCQGKMNCKWQLAVCCRPPFGRPLPTARCYQLSEQRFTLKINFRIRDVHENVFFDPIL